MIIFCLLYRPQLREGNDDVAFFNRVNIDESRITLKTRINPVSACEGSYPRMA